LDQTTDSQRPYTGAAIEAFGESIEQHEGYVPPHRVGYVYVFMCQDETGPLYVKIGYSVKPAQRLASLLTHSPVPPVHIWTTQTGSARSSHLLEQWIHKNLKKYHSRREWYRFDILDPQHKEDFHTVLNNALAQVEVGEKVWKKVDFPDGA
jgi:hypothetical protein